MFGKGLRRVVLEPGLLPRPFLLGRQQDGVVVVLGLASVSATSDETIKRDHRIPVRRVGVVELFALCQPPRGLFHSQRTVAPNPVSDRGFFFAHVLLDPQARIFGRTPTLQESGGTVGGARAVEVAVLVGLGILGNGIVRTERAVEYFLTGLGSVRNDFVAGFT